MKGAKKEVKNSRFLHTITTTIQVVLVTSVRTAPPIHGGGGSLPVHYSMLQAILLHPPTQHV